MSRRTAFAVVFGCLVAFTARADKREQLFQGFEMKLERITDAMTDERTCALFVENGPIYLSVEGRSKVTVWANSDSIHFAPDGKHLLRIGASAPVRLTSIPKRNALTIAEPATAGQLVKALASRQPVRIRYVDWPSYSEQDVTIEVPAFAYVWGKATKQCGWPTLGVPTDLPEPKLSVYQPTEQSSAGYAAVSVPGNRELGLKKGFDKYGGGCQVTLGVHDTIGLHGGTWTSGTVDLAGDTKFTVRDQIGTIVFEGKVPTRYGMSAVGGTSWPLAKAAADAMWKSAPFGSVSITGGSYPQENVPLYGFRELWAWGQKNCSFPSLDQLACALTRGSRFARNER